MVEVANAELKSICLFKRKVAFGKLTLHPAAGTTDEDTEIPNKSPSVLLGSLEKPLQRTPYPQIANRKTQQTDKDKPKKNIDPLTRGRSPNHTSKQRKQKSTATITHCFSAPRSRILHDELVAQGH
jgi:hypothetical protein